MLSPAIQSPPQPTSATSRASIAFVTCVETGGLEEQTIRMVKSLRQWGGQYADAPVYAVNPRFGVPLATSTMRALDDLNVIFRRIRPANPYPWNSYINKPLALIDVEEQARTDAIAWLDGDILILGEPTELAPDDQSDFTACVPDKNIGTASDDDEYAPYWREACNMLGMKFADLPWTITHREQQRIRLYFNSGVFAYRRNSGFGRQFLSDCTKLLDAKIASHESGIFFTDQVSLVLTMLKMQMRYRTLPHAYNYAIGAKIEHLIDPQKLAGAKVLHYHDAMWPAFWPKLLGYLKNARPDVHDWLAPMGPIHGKMSPMRKIAHKMLGNYRRRKRDRHQAGCRVL
jgi:hypothetical protein